MSEYMTALEMVEAHLRANGYDGLCSPDGDCGCEVDDLAPCGEMNHACTAGHKVPCEAEECDVGGGCPWHIKPGKREASGE